MPLDQSGSTTDEVLGFVPKEPGCAYEVFQFCRVGGGKAGCCGKAGKERRGHLVDPNIGTLGGKNRCDQQLPRIAMVECTVRIGVSLFEAIKGKLRMSTCNAGCFHHVNNGNCLCSVSVVNLVHRLFHCKANPEPLP